METGRKVESCSSKEVCNSADEDDPVHADVSAAKSFNMKVVQKQIATMALMSWPR